MYYFYDALIIKTYVCPKEFKNLRTIKKFSCSLSSEIQAGIITNTFSQFLCNPNVHRCPTSEKAENLMVPKKPKNKATKFG